MNTHQSTLTNRRHTSRNFTHRPVNISNRLIILLTIGSSLLFGGCSTETTSSENVTTQGIFADMIVEAKQNGVGSVKVQLSVGGPTGTTIDLASGERLEAEVNGITQVLQEDNDILSVDYETVFNTDTSGAAFTISFYRSNGDVLDNSRVTLPENISISSPQAGQVYSVDDNIPVIWTASSNTGQGIRLSHITSCTNNDGTSLSFSESSTVADNGSFTLALSGLMAATSDLVNRNIDCSIDLMLFRANTGSIDSRYGEGGNITAEQSREVENVALRF